MSKAIKLLDFKSGYNQEKGLNDYIVWHDANYGTKLTAR